MPDPAPNAEMKFGAGAAVVVLDVAAVVAI